MLTPSQMQLGFLLVIASLTAIVYILSIARTPRSKSAGKRTYRAKYHTRKFKGHDLQEVLEKEFEEDCAITIKSVSDDLDGEHVVCTVEFGRTPAGLEGLPRDRKYNILPCVSLDASFIGLSVLHCPSAIEHEVDVIIVHGLGGHAFGSFKERNGDHMWPRDSLPEALTIANSENSIARIMTYGYDSTVQGSDSVQHITDIAESFLESVIELARDREPKPIIFVGHSMGGLVIKEVEGSIVFSKWTGNADALIILSRSKSSKSHAANYQKLFRATCGVAFFGVPHAGMNIESIRAMAEDNPNRSLIDSLSLENSHFLSQQLPQFDSLLDNKAGSKLDVIYFYETAISPTAQKDKRGVWKMTGPKRLLVPSLSASPRRDLAISKPIERSHSNMVKFGLQDDEWRKVSGRLNEFVFQILTRQKDEKHAKIDNIAETHMQECRQSLGFGHLDMRGRTNHKERQAGTCDWLLDGPEFRSWAGNPGDENNKPVSLFLKGKPGSGKSVLMNAAFKQCTEYEDTQFKGPITLGFFFDARTGKTHYKSEAGMYGGLLLQVMGKLRCSSVSDQTSLSNSILAHRDADQTWSAKGIRDAFLLALEHLSSRQIFLFLDALDECEDLEILKFFEFIDNISPRSSGRRLKLCISSRPSLDLIELRWKTISINVAANNKSDIEALVMAKLKPLHKVWSHRFHKDVRRKLSNSASGVFLWVDLVTERILGESIASGRTEEELLQYIESIPKELKDLYEHLLGHIQDQDRIEALDLFLLVLVSKRSLTVMEVKSMLECSKGPRARPSKLELKVLESRFQSVFCGLVEPLSVNPSSEPVVNFIHKSFKDFLIENAGLRILDNRFKRGPNMMAQLHLGALNICMRMVDYESIHNYETSPEPFLPYAAQFWMAHARQADSGITEAFQYADILDQCSSYKSDLVVDMVHRFDNFQSYEDYVGTDEVPNTTWLNRADSEDGIQKKDPMIVLLAFEGCTNLVIRHLKACTQCLSSGQNGTVAGHLEKAFFLAAHRGFTTTVDAILNSPAVGGMEMNIDTIRGGMTALYAACLKGKIATIDCLLHHKADPLKSLSQPYEFPLHAAAAHDDMSIIACILQFYEGQHLEMRKLLSSTTSAGYTVFHQAVLEGRITVLDRLLSETKKNADVAEALKVQTKKGRTAHGVALALNEELETLGELQVPATELSIAHAIRRLAAHGA